MLLKMGKTGKKWWQKSEGEMLTILEREVNHLKEHPWCSGREQEGSPGIVCNWSSTSIEIESKHLENFIATWQNNFMTA